MTETRVIGESISVLDQQMNTALRALGGASVVWGEFRSDPALSIAAAQGMLECLQTILALTKAVRQGVVLYGEGTRLAVVSSAPPGMQ